ncbi:MAG: HlyD family efflux transporter periplasmic adaptor subunit [Planctomycetota bacterium]
MFKKNATLFGAIVGLVCAAGIQASVSGQVALPPESNTGGILIEGCMVRYINKTQVPAELQGKLTELNVEEGMTIKKGDAIAIIDDRQSQLVLKQKLAEEAEAKIAAENDINRRDAVNSEKIAVTEAQTYIELHEKGAAPYLEMKKKQLEAERASLRIELADQNEQTAMAVYLQKQYGVQLAKMDIEMRTIRSDFDAFVEKRVANLGEWVQPGSPIVELVQMDRLRVQGFIDALNYGRQVYKGAPVVIEVTVGQDASGAKTRVFQGVIEYVSTELDLKKRHRVWVSIPNEQVGDDWLIKPGMRATMRILPKEGAARDGF